MRDPNLMKRDGFYDLVRLYDLIVKGEGSILSW
jgi:hypothetical protein